MAMSRYDYEKQHEYDVHKIETLSKTVHEQEIIIHNLNERVNDLNYINTLLVNEQNRINHDVFNPVRKVKLTENMIKMVKSYQVLGWSQRQIAKALGVSVGLVNKACNLPADVPSEPPSEPEA